MATTTTDATTITVSTGQVRNGAVVLDEGTPALPEGAPVRVAIDLGAALARLSRDLLEVAGTAEGLPADLAEQHDHYLHGQPKRRPRGSPIRSISSPCSTRGTGPTPPAGTSPRPRPAPSSRRHGS